MDNAIRLHSFRIRTPANLMGFRKEMNSEIYQKKLVTVEESSGNMTSETSNFDYLALKEEGNALYSAGDYLGAVQKYSKGLILCTDNNTDRNTLLKNRAAAYLNLREYQKVIDDTTAALEITPSDIKALYRRCQAYEELGKYNEAFEDARAVNRLNPQNSAIQPYLRRLQEMNEGNAFYSAGDFLAAVQKYSKCLKLCTDKNTDRSTLLKNRAAAYLNLGEYHKVVEDTTAALEIAPRDMKALYRRCQAYEQLGKYNEAFEDARAVNHLNPQNSAIQPYLRRLQEIKPVIIEELRETVLSDTSNLDYIALKNEGNALYSAGDFPAAVQKYSKCLQLCTDKNTDRSTLLKNRAAAYLNLGEYQKVVEDTTAALEITPTDIKALYRRCQAYEKLGKYNEAFEDAKAAYHLNPQNSAIQPYFWRLQEIVNESNDDAVDINSLPNEIILKIFAYLTQNQLGQIARVCRRWNVFAKSGILWKTVNVKLFPSHGSEIIILKSFINSLPSCVTSIQLDFAECEGWISFNFVEFCMKLQEKCPHLEELNLNNSELSYGLPSVIDICTQFLQNVKKLIFKSCAFPDYSERREYGCTSKIEFLDLSWCALGYFNKSLLFSRMPCLKVLCLSDTDADNTWLEDDASFLNRLLVLNVGFTNIFASTFSVIKKHGLNLKELYLCIMDLQDHDLAFNKSVFPHLKTICLSCPYLTCEGVVSVIQSCPSLQNVYADAGAAKSFATHPFVVANRCKSGIVKVVYPRHDHNVDYTHN